VFSARSENPRAPGTTNLYHVMNSKPLLFVAAISASGWITSLPAQGGGAGAGSAGAGSTGGASSGATSGATGSATTSSGTAAPSLGGTTGDGTPDMTSTMPSRSVPDTATPPNTGSPTPAGALPPGLSVAPVRPGISPLTGLPLSDIPTESRGTTPLGPRIETPAPVGGSASTTTRDTAPAAGVNDPGAIAAHPQTNPRIGMGVPIFVPTPPPAAQPETSPPASTNDLGQVWVAGHFSWVGGQWTWVDGMWQRPPDLNAVWVPGHYDAQTKRWTEGHWERGASPAARANQRAQPER
jgi:hypothetical protein